MLTGEIAACNLQDRPSRNKRRRTSKQSHEACKKERQQNTNSTVAKASGQKRTRNSNTDDACKPNEKISKIMPQVTQSNNDCFETGFVPYDAERNWCFYCVDEQWQRRACAKLCVQFHNFNRLRPGGPDVPLTPPDPRRLRRISDDGNCLFCSFSYIITGSESEHLAIHRAILRHMVDIAHLLLGGHLINYDSVDKYVQVTGMDKDRTWGTEVEMMTLPHLLQTPLYTYNVP